MVYDEPDFDKKINRYSILEYLEDVCGFDPNINIREYCTPASALLISITDI